MTNPTVSSLSKEVKAIGDKLATLEYNLAEYREEIVSTNKNICLLIRQNQASTDAKFQTLIDSFENLIARIECSLPTTSSQPPRQTSSVDLTSPPLPPQNNVSSATTEPKQSTFSHESSQQDVITQYGMPTITFGDHQLPHRLVEHQQLLPDLRQNPHHRQLRDTHIQSHVTRLQPCEVIFKIDYDYPPDHNNFNRYQETTDHFPDELGACEDVNGRLYQEQDGGTYDGSRHRQRQARARLKLVYMSMHHLEDKVALLGASIDRPNNRPMRVYYRGDGPATYCKGGGPSKGVG